MLKKLSSSMWSTTSAGEGASGAPSPNSTHNEQNTSAKVENAAASAGAAASAAGASLLGFVRRTSEVAYQKTSTAAPTFTGASAVAAQGANTVSATASVAANQAANAASSLYGYLRKAATAVESRQGPIDNHSPSDFGEGSSRDGSSSTSTTAAGTAASMLAGLAHRFEAGAKVIAKEGASRAKELKKVMENADMDALQRKLANLEGPYRGSGDIDPSSINFTYVTDRIIVMGFPSTPDSRAARASGKPTPIDTVSKLLKTSHPGKFMIWNLSEEPYDYAKFDDQVLEFKFPGYPAPPLGMLFNMCQSIEHWLDADSQNVAVVHCLTGKGRTGTVVASYLTWIGECDTAMEALQYVSQKRGTSVEKITIPSQRRYIQYFTNMMEGLKPRPEPLFLRRVIINSIPTFAKWTVRNRNDAGEVVEIFKNGKLIFTTTWKDGATGGVAWARVKDGSHSFPIDTVLHGDILIRCRHLTEDGQRISMFRAAFHTGYIPLGILRLTKAQLDGACQDSRFTTDFFVDFIFAPVTSSASPVAPSEAPLAASEGLTVSGRDKEAYDDMLSRDESFWEEIAKRKALRHQKAEKLRPTVHEPLTATAFSIISGDENINVEYERPARGSWDASHDVELLAQLESLTTTLYSKAPSPSPAPTIPLSINTSLMPSASGNDGYVASEKQRQQGPTSSSFAITSASSPDHFGFITSGNPSVTSSPVAPSSTFADQPEFSSTEMKDVPTPSQLHDEIAALAELEKELGLESLSSTIRDLPLGTEGDAAAPKVETSKLLAEWGDFSDLGLDNIPLDITTASSSPPDFSALGLSPPKPSVLGSSSGPAPTSAAASTSESAAKKGSSAAGGLDFDDNFDELEEYLKNLSTK